ncbi:MAG: phosphate ABC transporter substrate-binding protein PstS [Anaerolineales bacterium]|jgi:phosphate transport system substrate-binding protein
MSIKRSALFVGLVLALVLSACGSQPAPVTTVEVTRMVEGTPQVMVITATPEAQVAAGSIQINGAGATFPLPVYTEWTYAYQYVDPSVAINYQGIGSGGGKKAIVDRTVDFAGSDSLLKDDEYSAGGDLQMYPMIAGAVVPIYNVEGLTSDDPTLILSREVLVGIYDGTINTWNDPAIVALNPSLADKLPKAGITAVHRSDGSGTTEIFTKALSSFSPEWKANVGAGSSIEWPVDKAGNGVGGKGNQGVAAAVQNTANSIGYVELSYAVSNKITFAQMINKAGSTVTADAASLQSAMADFAGSFSDRLTTDIVDGSGAGSWPIAGYTYLVLHTSTMEDCAKAAKLLEYVRWTLTDAGAAQRASDLGYAVLPDAVREQVLAKLGEVTCSGAPVMSGG